MTAGQNGRPPMQTVAGGIPCSLCDQVADTGRWCQLSAHASIGVNRGWVCESCLIDRGLAQ